MCLKKWNSFEILQIWVLHSFVKFIGTINLSPFDLTNFNNMGPLLVTNGVINPCEWPKICNLKLRPIKLGLVALPLPPHSSLMVGANRLI